MARRQTAPLLDMPRLTPETRAIPGHGIVFTSRPAINGAQIGDFIKLYCDDLLYVTEILTPLSHLKTVGKKRSV